MNKSQEQVRKFVADRDWHTQLPDHVAKSISIEAAELLELFQWASPSVAEIKNDPEKLADIKAELADVFVYALQMSLLFNLDVDEIIKDKLAFADKKYPAKLMKQRSAGDGLATKKYLEIKKSYR